MGKSPSKVGVNPLKDGIPHFHNMKVYKSDDDDDRQNLEY